MNRPLNFSPSRSFSFAPSEAPAASWSVPPRLPVIRECVYRVARFLACPPAFLFIGPQVRSECKTRKKVPRPFRPSSSPLLPALPRYPSPITKSFFAAQRSAHLIYRASGADLDSVTIFLPLRPRQTISLSLSLSLFSFPRPC